MIWNICDPHEREEHVLSLLNIFKLNFWNHVAPKVIDIRKCHRISLFDVVSGTCERGGDFILDLWGCFIFACKCTSLLYNGKTIHFTCFVFGNLAKSRSSVTMYVRNSVSMTLWINQSIITHKNVFRPQRISAKKSKNQYDMRRGGNRPNFHAPKRYSLFSIYRLSR